MKNEWTDYLEPEREIVFRIPASGAEPTQVWRVPIEPRMRITRGGEGRFDWRLLAQTLALFFTVGLLPMLLLLRWKPAPPAEASATPQLSTQTAVRPPAAPESRSHTFMRTLAPASRQAPRYTVPPAAPTR